MAEVPANEPDLNTLLKQWADQRKTLAAAKAAESMLRKSVFHRLFPAPVEGTQYADLGGGWRMKCQLPYNRKIDERVLPAVLKELPDGTEDKLVRYKPDLDVKYYKGMPEEMRAVFDECLTTEPGSPQLSFVPPKEEK